MFEVRGVIGGGGLTVVYLARDIRRDAMVALKVLRPEMIETDHGRRFLREIEITRSLHHPGVMMVFDSGIVVSKSQSTIDYVFFTLDYVKGETLRTRLMRERQLPVGDALQIIGSVADALQYAHERKVVHRDIQPKNIFLTSDSRVLLSDFGVARGVESSTNTFQTAQGFVIGTVSYLSPEGIRAEPHTAKSDQYALACVLYEMLAGRLPFEGNSQAVLLAHLSESPDGLDQIRPGVPPHVSAAVARALSKVPSDRFASVADFRAALFGQRRVVRHSIWGALPATIDENLCFVIMPFGATPGVQEIYRDHVEPLVRSCGLTPQRADDIFGHHEIIVDIWRAISRARVLIADLTGRNPNVFYELGMAHAIGKDVVILTQDSKDVPFDLTHLRHIAYQYSPRGVKELERALRGTLEAVLREGDE